MNLTYDGKIYEVSVEDVRKLIDTKVRDDLKEKFYRIFESCIDTDVKVSNSPSTLSSGSGSALNKEAVYKERQEERNKEYANKSVIDTPEEMKFMDTNRHGLEAVYDTSSWGSNDPDMTRIVGAPHVKIYSDDGQFIGSLNIKLPAKREIELDPPFNQCDDFKICVPSFSIPDLDWLDNLGKDEITRRVIDEINRLAEEVDTVPQARNLIVFLSNEYKNIPNQIREQLYPDTQALLKAYQLVTIPNKEPEYQDLSAYLNAPFPELNLEYEKDNSELEDLLKKLDDLKLEELETPIICSTNEDLTTKVVDGSGIFDHIASSIFNQLDMVKRKGLITNNEIAQVYSSALVQGLQISTQYALESKNQKLQSYQLKIEAAKASADILRSKAELLMLPAQMRLAYAQIQAQLKQMELLNVQVELEKAKYPQVIAQTDLILAQTDTQRLSNEQVQVAIQQGKLALVQTQEQIALMQEQNKQAQLQTELTSINLEQAREQTKSLVLQNNKLIEDTKMVDAQTQFQLKQVELADIQKIQAKAQIKLMAQQLDKEKQNISLIKAQTASAFAQLSLIKDQMKASRAQYSDTIDGKPVGGLLGAQITVNKVQASSFERKAFMEMIAQAQQGWAANKTADIAISSPATFTPLAVDRLINWGMTKYFNMPEDTLKMPVDYTPYLTDEQMDAEEPVNYKTKR